MAAETVDFASMLESRGKPKTTSEGYVDFATALTERPAVEDTAKPPPYWQAEGFAGQSYFDEAEKELINKYGLNMVDPSMRQALLNRPDIKSQFDTLRTDREQWMGAFPEELKALPEIETSRAIGGGTSGKQYAGLLVTDLLAPEDKDKVSILENAGWKVDMVGGFPKITNPETGQEFSLNKPGFSGRDVADFIATALQFAGAGAATNLVKGIGRKAAVGATGAAITEASKQTIEKALGGEFDLGEVGIAGLFGGATELAIPALRGIWRKLSPAGREQLLAAKSVADIKKLGVASEEELANIQSLITKATESQQGLKQATGVEVPIYRGQATELPSQLLEQRYLTQLDPTSRKAMEALKSQDDATYRASMKVLNTIAPEETIDISGRQLRDAADKVVEARKLAREQLTSPLYDAAREASKQNPIQIADFKKRLSSEIGRYDPQDQLTGILKKFKGMIDRSKGDFDRLQRAKFFIDETLQGTGESSIAKHNKRYLQDLKKEFLDAMEKESPEFIEANKLFAQESGPVEQLMDSIVGKVSRIKDDQLDSVTSVIFNKLNTPSAVSNAKKAIESVDPEAWNQIVRRELFNRIAGIESLAKDQGKASMPGKLRSAIFGNPNQRRVLLQAVDGEPRKNLLYLEHVLSLAETGRAAGSPTSPYQVIREKLLGRIKVYKQMFAAPLETAAGVGDETLFNRNAKALAEIVYDPQWTKEISKIRAMGADSPEAGKALSDLFDTVARSSVQASREQANQSTETEQ